MNEQTLISSLPMIPPADDGPMTTDTELLDWLGDHYARLLCSSWSGPGREFTTVRWTLTDHDWNAAHPWCDDRINTRARGDFRAAIRAAVRQEREMLRSLRSPSTEEREP